MVWPSILGFANHSQYVDTHDLASSYLLICWSNDWAPSIKVVVHGGVSKLCFGPSPNSARNKLKIASHLAYSDARHVLDDLPTWSSCASSRPTIVDTRPASPAAPLHSTAIMEKHQSALVVPPPLPTPPPGSPSRPLPPSGARHRLGRAGARATPIATVDAPSPNQPRLQPVCPNPGMDARPVFAVGAPLTGAKPVLLSVPSVLC